MTETNLPKAAMVLIMHNGKVLAVSRKDDHTQMGLPGGKVEEGETFTSAAIRETREETGLDIQIISHVFDLADEQVIGKTFLCEIIGEIPEIFFTMESGRVAWVEWQELFDGPFGKYNRALFIHIFNEYIQWKSKI